MTLADEDAAKQWLREVLHCDDAAMARLEAFVAMLSSENKLQNLVAEASLEQVWVRHIADSVQLLSVSRGTPGPWLDLGTGAGFPGLIIALVDPGREVLMVESRGKRVAWLQSMVDRFSLSGSQVIAQRLEQVPTMDAGIISARAFAPLDRLVALAGRFSTPQTQWILPKGRNGSKELDEMPDSIKTLFHVEQSLTDPNSVILVGRGCISSARQAK